ncbi:hypothetical protein AAFX33_13455 [Vibrio chagasii]|uniref:Ig-like domain-containing protein n=1 Tax=Vibrio chagasii TaxID=170679 RepID=UPI0038CD9BD1
MSNFLVNNSNYRNLVAILIVCFSILFIQGCRYNSNDSIVESVDLLPEETKVTLHVSDTYTSGRVGEETQVNLAPYILTSDGSTALLSNVDLRTSVNTCPEANINGLSFQVKASSPGLCVYEHIVTDYRGRSLETGTSIISVSGISANSSKSTPLPTISEIAEIDETIEIKLTNPGSMYLSSEVTLQGTGRIIEVDTANEVIVYQAGSNEEDVGSNRIFYYYIDDNEYVRSGWIDIAVSLSTYNSAPKVDDFYFLTDEDAEIGHTYSVVEEGEKILIDVAEHIYDSDNDELQLVNITAFNAQTSLIDPVNTGNTSFSFRSNTPGQYQVSYTVSDHKGGYATGIVEVRVSGAWDNVIIEETKDVFAAPLSILAASVAGYHFSGTNSEMSPPNGNGTSNVPTYDWQTASAVCVARGGSLPTSEQWQSFIEQEGNPYLKGDTELDTVSDWPIATQFWTGTSSGDQEFETVDLKEGTFHTQGHGLNGGEAYLGYVACIDKTPTSLKIVSPDLVAVNQVNYLEADYQTASGLSFPYTRPLIWGYSEPVGSDVEPIENIQDNVSLDPYSGALITYDTGHVNIDVSDLLGELTDSKVIESVDNLLVIDDQLPSFEYNGADSSSCSELTLHTYVKHDHPSSGNAIYYLDEIGIKFSQYVTEYNTTAVSSITNHPVGTTVKLLSGCDAPEGNSFLRVHGIQVDPYTGGGEAYTPSFYFNVNRSIDETSFEEVELTFKARLVSDIDPETASVPTYRLDGVRLHTGFLGNNYDLYRNQPMTIFKYLGDFNMAQKGPASQVDYGEANEEGWVDFRIIFPINTINDRIVFHMDFDWDLGNMYFDFDDIKLLAK